MKALEHDETREADLQKVCYAILYSSTIGLGDYGAMCPFCCVRVGCDEKMSELPHKPNCAYLIAKDLLTK
jgi:hypothetical protein